jgi:chromosome segregation protein
MMGEQAFEKLQQQIKSKENDRQSITDQLKQLKKERIDVNEDVESHEGSIAWLINTSNFDCCAFIS